VKQAIMDELLVNIEQTVDINAAPEKVFEGLIAHLCEFPGEEGKPALKFKLERRPGGRWYRDLGNDAGHLWGFVQAIRPPTLLELYGPMFMSYPVSGHLIIRLAPTTNGTKVAFKNDFFGPAPAELREEMGEGWGQMLTELKRDMEQ
jgi:uncharacterized protein YndB with AHSA1/START domain